MQNNIQDTQKENNQKPKWSLFSKNISLTDKYRFYEYWFMMLNNGISIEEGLVSASSRISSVFLKEKIHELSLYVRSGDSVAAGMRKMPQVFVPWEVAIIEAGESQGTFVDALLRVSESLKKICTLRNKVHRTLTPPLILGLFFFIALLLGLGYLIPAFHSLLDTSVMKLPMITQSLVFVSELMRNNFLFTMIALFGVFIFFLLYTHTIAGRMQIEYFLLSFPILGKAYRNYILARIAYIFGSLIRSGVSFAEALNLLTISTDSIIYAGLLDEISLGFSQDMGLIDCINKVDPQQQYFPIDFSQMLGVWNKKIPRDTIHPHCNDFYEKGLDSSLLRFTKIIELFGIMMFGAFIFWFTFGIFAGVLKFSGAVF